MAMFNASLFGPFEPGRSRPVKVEIRESGFVFAVPGGQSFELPATGAKVTRGGFDGKAIIIDGKVPGGTQLHAVITDPAFPSAMLSQGPSSLREAMIPPREVWFWEDFSFSFDWAGKHKAVSIPVALLCAWLLFTILVEIIVAVMPVTWETSLGQMVAQSLIHEERVLKSGPAVEIVDTTWKRVQKGIPANPYTWQIFVVDSPTVNALAAPGGQIVVYTGLLKMMKSPEELAGVLGHEVTHALRRHGIRSMVRSSVIAIVVTMVVGDGGGALTSIVRDFGQELANRSHSRSHEREADRGAVEIMTRAQIDPSGFSTFLGRLAAKEGQFGTMLGLLSTHPPSSERMQDLKQLSAGPAKPVFQPIETSMALLIASEPAELPPEKNPKAPVSAVNSPKPPAKPSKPGVSRKPIPAVGRPAQNR